MRKVCTNCKIEKDVKSFYKKKNGKLGCHSECKICLKEKNKNYRKENPEKILIRDREYQEKLRSLYGNSHTGSHIRMKERSTIGFERYAEKKMQLLAGSLLNYAVRINIIRSKTPKFIESTKKTQEGA